MRKPEVSTARKLRRAMTLPEVLLWQRLRGAATGAKFRRQHPIGPYVVDFYCAEAGLPSKWTAQYTMLRTVPRETPSVTTSCKRTAPE